MDVLRTGLSRLHVHVPCPATTGSGQGVTIRNPFALAQDLGLEGKECELGSLHGKGVVASFEWLSAVAFGLRLVSLVAFLFAVSVSFGRLLHCFPWF